MKIGTIAIAGAAAALVSTAGIAAPVKPQPGKVAVARRARRAAAR